MIVIDLDNLNLSKEAEALLDTISDFTPLLKDLAAAAEGIWLEKFRREGPGWLPLAESTLEKRRKEGKDANILRDDGRLFMSLTDSASEGAVRDITPTSLEIGTNLEYAAVHQLGSKDGRIPARPFLPDEREVIPDFERVIRNHFQRRASS